MKWHSLNKLNIDVWEVIDATQNPLVYALLSGPWFRWPLYSNRPQLFILENESLNYDARFVGLAEQINTSMPDYVLKENWCRA